MSTLLTLKRLIQKIGFAFGLFRRDNLPPEVERDAVKKVFVPVGRNSH
jgi:hypothetical protein